MLKISGGKSLVFTTRCNILDSILQFSTLRQFAKFQVFFFALNWGGTGGCGGGGGV